MKLSALAAELFSKAAYDEAEVTYITDNSEKVIPGAVFVCVNGKHFDGHTKASEAFEKGAAAIICERDLGLKNQIIVENSRSAYARACSLFFDCPANKIKLIGITGTNGKTTTAFVIKSAFDKLGVKSGMIGTVKNCVGSEEFEASLTTPDPFELYGLIDKMVKAGCEYCVMEVSSQAIDLHRVDGIRFDAAVFTNLTRDHLDYHGTLDNYIAAKHKLFENTDIAIINSDDEHAGDMVENVRCKTVTYSLKSNNSDYSAKNERISAKGVRYELVSNEQIGRVSFVVPGEFSIYNSMAAIVCLVELGFDFRQVISAVEQSSGVPGRMEAVDIDRPFTVLIDYAHTPDGLENVLNTVKAIASGKIIAVFGCGGDRDKTKRPIMGDIGTRLADVAIITSDNPRSEDPKKIIEDISAGINKYHTSKVYFECDRTKAIEKALSVAEEGDIVVLAGKGHETYQILSTGKIHYDEREIVRSFCK